LVRCPALRRCPDPAGPALDSIVIITDDSLQE
jgi:hypothetical protein